MAVIAKLKVHVCMWRTHAASLYFILYFAASIHHPALFVTPERRSVRRGVQGTNSQLKQSCLADTRFVLRDNILEGVE